MLDVPPGEAGQPPGHGAHERCATGNVHRPVEEVGLDHAADLRGGKEPTAEQRGRRNRRVGRVEPDHGMGDDLRGRNEQGVLDEQLFFAAEGGAQGRGQQPRPQLPLERHTGVVAVLPVQRGEVRDVQRVRRAVGAQSPRDLRGGRGDLLRSGEDAFQPHAQPNDVGGAGVDQQRRDQPQRVGVEVVEVPLRAVGEHPHVALLQGRSAGRDVAGELLHGVGSNVAYAQVPLHLEHGEPNLDIDPPALASGRLQHDLIEVLIAQIERGRGQQQV